MTTVIRLGVVLAVLLLVACSGPKSKLEKCHKEQEYQEARVAPRVRTPDDLAPLDEDARLPVPFGDTKTYPTPSDQPCLIEPPDYLDQSPN